MVVEGVGRGGEAAVLVLVRGRSEGVAVEDAGGRGVEVDDGEGCRPNMMSLSWGSRDLRRLSWFVVYTSTCRRAVAGDEVDDVMYVTEGFSC